MIPHGYLISIAALRIESFEEDKKKIKNIQK
jgi:hypothetical protein